MAVRTMAFLLLILHAHAFKCALQLKDYMRSYHDYILIVYGCTGVTSVLSLLQYPVRHFSVQRTCEVKIHVKGHFIRQVTKV